MFLNRALVLAVVLTAAPSLAHAQSTKLGNSLAAAGTATTGDAGDQSINANGLVARKPFTKPVFVVRPAGESRLAIKFTDQAKARATPDKSVQITSFTDKQAVDTIKSKYNLSFVPAVHMSAEKVNALIQRAEQYSGKAQPDVLGMMYIDGPDSKLQEAANELIKLDSVEYVFFQQPWKVYDDNLGPPATAACCLYSQGVWACSLLSQEDCETFGGVFTGEEDCTGANCQFDCGDDLLASCFEAHAYPGCNDDTCCTLVGNSRPFCVDANMAGEWDIICVALANLICSTPPGEPDRCLTPFNDDCFEAHPAGGCLDTDCCHTVCMIDPFCCSNQWDDVCVGLAFDNCGSPPDTGPTPNFCAYQGYLRGSNYDGQLGGPFPYPGLPPSDFDGYAGEGMSLFDESANLCDNEQMPAPGRYVGLYGLGRQLKEVYGVGANNGARGRGVKVAVIEWACYKDHEDLNVISEPGQTLILIPSATHPDHATACLGILNAKENGFGMTGIAPDAQAYFFPLTSVEEGPRFLDAFLSCYTTLGPGDVVSCSFGPGGGNLNTDAFSNSLISLGTSLGILTCVAAGNDCVNLDGTNDLGDSGAIVVGACQPGVPHCRLTFSNYFRGAGNDSSQKVHCSAWGQFVASTGGSANLFFPGQNWNRSYTTTFNGTSAATPQVAAAAACLQGMAKQFYGIPLPVGVFANGRDGNFIRAALVSSGFPQCGITNTNDLPGFDPQLPCGPDINPDFEGNLIGAYIQPRGAAETILSQDFTGFDQSPFVHDFFVIRGNKLFGNKFSIKGSDNNYLILQSVFTDRNFQPHPNYGQDEASLLASKVHYYATAYTTDMMVRATMTTKVVGAMGITAEVAQSDQTAILYYEMYDWTLGQWTFAAFDVLPAGVEATYQHAVTPATRFVNPTNRNVYLRLYILSFATPSTGFTPTNGTAKRIDWVNITPSIEFGQVLNPGGGGIAH